MENFKGFVNEIRANTLIFSFRLPGISGKENEDNNVYAI